MYLKINSFDTENVIDFGRVFFWTTKFGYLDLNSFRNYEGEKTNIPTNYMFSDTKICTLLMENFDVSGGVSGGFFVNGPTPKTALMKLHPSFYSKNFVSQSNSDVKTKKKIQINTNTDLVDQLTFVDECDFGYLTYTRIDGIEMCLLPIENCLNNIVGIPVKCQKCKNGYVLGEGNITCCSELNFLNCIISIDSNNCFICREGYFKIPGTDNCETKVENCHINSEESDEICKTCANNYIINKSGDKCQMKFSKIVQ